MTRRSTYLAVAALLALALAAAIIVVSGNTGAGTAPPTATQATQTTQAAPRQPASRITLTDALGRKVSVQLPIRRIALIDGGETGYIATVDAVGGPGAIEKVVALDLSAWRSRLPGLYRLYTERFPGLLRAADIGSTIDGSFSVERLLEAKPSVVVAPVSAYANLSRSGALKRLEDAGIPVVFLHYFGDVNETARSIEVLGKLLGSEEHARKLASWLVDRYKLVVNRLHDIIDRPAAYLAAGSGEAVAATLRNFTLVAGGRVAAGAPGPRSPDAVLLAAAGEGSGAAPRLGPGVGASEALASLGGVVQRLGLGNSTAAMQGRICAIYRGLLSGAWSGAALEYVAKVLHPAVFRDLNPSIDLQEFFKEYLSVPFKGTWFVCVKPEHRIVEVIDALGRRVRVPSPAERIAVLYGLEDLTAVGGEPALARLVALNVFRYKKWRPDWWTAWVTHFPWLRRIPDVGQPGYSFDLEKLIAARPDVVVAAPWMYKAMEESGALRKLSEAGIPVVVVDFVPASTNITKHLEAVKRSLEVLGAITGRPERAKSLYEFYLHQLMLVVNKTRGLPESKRPGVIVFATWSPWRVYGARSPYNVWITLAGGRNLAASAVPGSSGTIDPEYVLREKPDVIVFTCNNNFYVKGGVVQRVVIGYTARSPEAAREALRSLIERPGWDTLPAVRSGRVYMLYHGLSHGHVFQFAALQWLAKWLHPELFKNLDPLANLRLFYEKYMPYPLRGVWAVGLREASVGG